ncbi:hypothetical protein [Agrobacterium tumefaciens]|uniref:hypothetical protein n=1 Tax=Agrobacterium tumefaciens TaxID=358 RepID=UPI001F1FD893
MPFALVINSVVDTVSFEDHSDEEGWVEVGDDVFGGFIHQGDGTFLPPEQPAPYPSITDYENAIQNLVDSTARDRQFRDGVTLASYTASTKTKWAAEAQAFVAWRDNVWFYAYGQLAKVQAGQRPQPTVEAFLAEIAPIAWPTA